MICRASSILLDVGMEGVVGDVVSFVAPPRTNS